MATQNLNAYAVQFRTKKAGRKPAGEWKTTCWVPMYVIDGEDGKPYTMGHRIDLGYLIARNHVEQIEWSSGTLEARAIPVHSNHYDDCEGDRIEYQAYYGTEEPDEQSQSA